MNRYLDKQTRLVGLLVEDEEAREIIVNIINNAYQLGKSDGQIEEIEDTLSKIKRLTL
jgi:hypothetical protein